MRTATVVVTPRFVDSVEDVVAFVGATNSAKAAQLDDEIEAKVCSLDQNARRGRMVPEVADDGIRELLIFRQEYRLIYRLNDARGLVEVLVVWPARRPLRLAELLDAE